MERVEAAELNKTIQKKQRNDIRRHTTATIEEVIQKGKGFKTATRKLNQCRPQFTGILEEVGSLATDRSRIVERACEFYEKL